MRAGFGVDTTRSTTPRLDFFLNALEPIPTPAPVPEPSSLVLVLSGVVALVAHRFAVR